MIQQRISLDSIGQFCINNVLQDDFSFGTTIDDTAKKIELFMEGTCFSVMMAKP